MNIQLNDQGQVVLNAALKVASSSDGSCCCCDTTVSLKTDCTSCLKEKVGHAEFGFVSDPPKFYLVSTRVQFCPGASPETCTQTDIFTPTTDCYPSDQFTEDVSCDSEECIGCAAAVDCIFTFGDPVATSATHAGWTGFAGQSINVDLSIEDKEDDLITRVLASMPDYSDAFESGNCSAYACFNEARTTLEVARFRYKFTFAEATCEYTINWQIKVTATDEDPTYEDFSEDISIGQTESSIYEILEPDYDLTIAEVVNITTG